MKHGTRFAPLQRDICRFVMGTSFWRVVPQDEADKLFDAYVARGGNCFDTALVYNKIEPVLGCWMKSRGNRSEIIIHAKAAHHETIQPPNLPFEYHRPRVTPAEIREDLDLTLTQLQADYVDIFTLHRDNPDQPVGPIVKCLAAEQEAGRIRAFGASNWSIPRIEEANRYASEHGLPGFTLNSPSLSLAFVNEPSWPNCVTACDRFSRSWHARTQMPLFAWSCLALGFFADDHWPPRGLKPSALQPLMQNRWGADVVRVYYGERNFERARRAREVAKQLHVTPTQIAFAWVLHQGEYVFGIAGARTEMQIAELFEAIAIRLNSDQIAWLNLE